jgi:hypothetical protein
MVTIALLFLKKLKIQAIFVQKITRSRKTAHFTRKYRKVKGLVPFKAKKGDLKPFKFK